MIIMEQVRKSYPSGDQQQTVLEGCDWKLAAGASASVIGPSGAGKSTLLHLLGALDRPDAGRIEVDGVDLAGLDETAGAQFRRSATGFVFQAHLLLPQLTALENVLLPTLAGGDGPDEGEARERAAALLKRVGLQDRMDHEPGRLSGGERQRVAVARALVLEPKLLLADEPTGALDEKTALALTDLLFELNEEKGVTLVVVTHSPDLARRAQEQWQLHEGRLKTV